MKLTKAEFLKIFDEHFNKVDEELVAVLKGHLLVEKVLNQIIEDFVFHADKIIHVRLSFDHKVQIARSMSLDHSDNSMWKLISALNTLRNDFAHQLDSEKRKIKFKNVQNIYEQETQGAEFEKIWQKGNVMGIAYTTTLVLGFLLTFHEEVLRFKEVVDGIDKVINKHRHKGIQP